jgi:hypothetical protein
MRAQLSGKKWMFLDVLTKLVLEKAIERIELRHVQFEEETGGNGADGRPPKEFPMGKAALWFPRHVAELDQCAHVLVKYEPTEDPKHPVSSRIISHIYDRNSLSTGFR